MKKKTIPRVIVLSGYGLNCEEETKFAFELAGAKADIVHLNDLIAKPKMLARYQIMAVPGGFSYGDDTGSGKAFANKMKNHLSKELAAFVARDTLVIGICNGFQILTNAGLLPGALVYNKQARYIDRFVDLKVEKGGANLPAGKAGSPWLVGIKNLSLPIAHGEGKFYADAKTLAALKKGSLIPFVYTRGEMCEYQHMDANPNGALGNIAGVLGGEGRILGMMPHPERAVFFHHLPNFPYLKEKYLRAGKTVPKYGPGLQIFKNAVQYFSR